VSTLFGDIGGNRTEYTNRWMHRSKKDYDHLLTTRYIILLVLSSAMLQFCRQSRRGKFREMEQPEIGLQDAYENKNEGEKRIA
jgi:hypothetical protein